MWRRSREWGLERRRARALAAAPFPCPRWALFCCLLLFPFPCPAGPFEDAAAAYRRGDYANAMRLYQSLADGGDPRAQNSLGRMYLRGQGAGRDYRQAMKWFRRAAALGVADAQFHLGEIYLREFGVEQDLVEAARWYTRAAEQGHIGAQFTLAVLYTIGRGVSRSPLKAVYWFERAASQGNAAAQVQLGIIYGAGQGVARDSVAAYKWFALGQANARESKLRAKASQNMNRLSRGMTPAQIAEAQRQAREWQPVPARGGQS
ncbi:sel1 repeat family protein [Sphingobium sp. JS3065]|uniref:tetratricopeptide repeat protein n=1 Tax=Sphingobium sp. JS3065 TaxID=2970925 RepID=UPI0022651587|nr:tetratricopeptide repeat protein [Sphingobium sp. JS3065]UZW57772.1 sel1 repeat family protein [Sphingobium sp. JS3065]